jgi:hypothetical protein
MARYTTGGAYGVPLMKFTLTYDGELPATTKGNNRTAEKWAIRKALHPQLQELWDSSDILKSAHKNRLIPTKSSFMILEEHHSVPSSQGQLAGASLGTERLDLCAPILVKSRKFIPLVRDTFALRCALRIKFLRKEEPGALIYQGGDMDNRLKTLFDALSVPDGQQLIEDSDAPDPMQCLLENDRLITGLAVDTEKLLTRPNASIHEVRLIIDVDVRVIHARSYNMVFLGD